MTSTPSPTISTLTSTPNSTITSSTKIDTFLTSSNYKTSTLLDSNTSPTSSSTQTPLTNTTIQSEMNKTLQSDEEIEPHLNEMNETLDKSDIDSWNLLKLSAKLKFLLKRREMKENNSLMTAMTVMDKMQKKSRTLSPKQMRDFNDNMVETCSDVLDHHQAWQKLKDPSSKVQLSSKILEYIQTTGFDLGCLKNLNKSNKIIKSNIAIEAFYFDSNTSMDININNSESRVVLPVGMPEPDPDSGCDRGTAVGSVVSKLTRYLTNKLPAHQQINSNIVAFSIQNTLNSTQIPNNIEPVKIM